MNKILLAGVIIVGAVTTTVIYKSISITESAKDKVVQFSQLWGMSQRDTASKIILDWSGTTILWNPQSIPSSLVKVNIIEKIENSSPVEYRLFQEGELVENIGKLFVAKTVSDSINLYVEVGCDPQYIGACVALPLIKL